MDLKQLDRKQRINEFRHLDVYSDSIIEPISYTEMQSESQNVRIDLDNIKLTLPLVYKVWKSHIWNLYCEIGSCYDMLI